MKTETVTKGILKLQLPGKIVDVSANNEVTIEFAIKDHGPLLREDAKLELIKGLSTVDGEILIERISHFAAVESIRSRIGIGCLSTFTSEVPHKSTFESVL